MRSPALTLLAVLLAFVVVTVCAAIHGSVGFGLNLLAVPLLLLVTSVFYHFRLGLQVVIEDYQHDESRVVLLVLLNLYVLVVYATAVFSILKVAFGAGS